ncbi:hypothetical protein Tco_0454976 [Tanacetum coccineum]
MAVLESCPKHNMAAYLEKTDGNTEFHEIISFLTRSSIHYALTLKNVPVPLDHFPINALTSKVFSFMVKKGKHFSGKVTPLFPNMLVQPTEDEGEGSERPSEPQPIPSPPRPRIIDVTDQAKEIKHLKTHIKKLKKKAKPVITHHSLDKEYIHESKIGRKEILKETVDANGVFSTDKKEVSTDRPDEGIVDQNEGGSATPTTPTPTLTIFGDDETIAQVLLNMSQAKAVDSVSREKEKGVELKDVENIERPRPTSTRSLLTLKPLLKIDPKDKGKKKIEEDESDTESEDINESEKKFKMLSNDEEIARKVQEDWEAEEEVKKKHSDLKNKTFEEIQALYEKVKRFDESFTVIGSNEDERKIKEMNEGASDPDKKKKFVKEDVLTKVPAKPDVAEQGTKKRKGGHMKMLARKRKRPQPDVDSDDEHRKCLKIVTFEGTIDSEIMERKSVIARLNKVSSPDGDYLVIYRANGNFRAFNYLLEVLHIFDRQDLFHLYDLVMKQYSEVTLEGIELILWGDLKIMMESSTEENDQKLEDGTVIHMLVERRYPLSKDLMQRMLDFGLEVEIESTVALDLIRFIKQQIGEE